jgi:WD40 repeat protein
MYEQVWDVAGDTYECEKTLEGHTYDIRALTVSEDRLYSGCYDMTIKVSRSAHPPMLHTHGCLSLTTVPSSRLQIWDVKTLECLRTITVLVGPPFSLRAYAPSNRLYSAGWNKPIDVHMRPNTPVLMLLFSRSTRNM